MFTSLNNLLYKVGFFLAALIFISIGVINYLSSSKVNEMDRQIRRTHTVLITLDGVEEKFKNAIISHRDFLLTGAKQDLLDFRKGPAQVRLRLEELKDLVRKDSLLYVRTAELNAFIDEKFKALETSAIMKLNGVSTDSVNHYLDENARRNLTNIRIVANEMLEIENARLQSLTVSAEKSIQISRAYIVAGNMIAFVILFLSFSLLIRQIKTRRMAEKSLLDQMERLEVVTHNMGAGLSIITPEFRIIWMNKVMKTLFGDLEEKTFNTVFPDGEKQEMIILPESMEAGSKIQEERILINKEGTRNWYQLIYTPLENTQQSHSMFLQLLVPVDERKALENSLMEAKEKAEESSRAKSEFLANMSHEIRTPMNAILGFTEILRDRMSADQGLNEYLRGIEVNGKTLMRIIDDILDLSKIEAGKLQIRKEMVNPHLLLEEIRTMFEDRARQKGIALRIIQDEHLPPGLELDETRIRQVLFNLVGNALKFTHSGFVELSFKTMMRKGCSRAGGSPYPGEGYRSRYSQGTAGTYFSAFSAAIRSGYPSLRRHRAWTDHYTKAA